MRMAIRCARATFEIAEQLRRVKGRPFVNVDMEPYNITALEAGLMRAVHFRKGCFVGNEILISRC